MTVRALAFTTVLAAILIPSCGGCSRMVKPDSQPKLTSVYCSIEFSPTVSIDKPVEAKIEVMPESGTKVLTVQLSATSRMVRFLETGEECVLVSPEDSIFKRRKVKDDFNGSGLPIGNSDGVRLFRSRVVGYR